jgi:hypothetical protein
METNTSHNRVAQMALGLVLIVFGLPIMSAGCKQHEKAETEHLMEPSGSGENSSQEPGTALFVDDESRHTIPEPRSLATNGPSRLRSFQRWGIDNNATDSTPPPITIQDQIETTTTRGFVTDGLTNDIADLMQHLDAAEERSRQHSINSPIQLMTQSPSNEDQRDRALRNYKGQWRWKVYARGQVVDEGTSDSVLRLAPSENLATVAIRRTQRWGTCRLTWKGTFTNGTFAGELVSEKEEYKYNNRLLSSKLIIVERSEMAVVSISSKDSLFGRQQLQHQMSLVR